MAQQHLLRRVCTEKTGKALALTMDELLWLIGKSAEPFELIGR